MEGHDEKCTHSKQRARNGPLQREAMARLRAGQQKVTVEYVHVYQGAKRLLAP
jgi:hypothetical protein